MMRDDPKRKIAQVIDAFAKYKSGAKLETETITEQESEKTKEQPKEQAKR